MRLRPTVTVTPESRQIRCPLKRKNWPPTPGGSGFTLESVGVSPSFANALIRESVLLLLIEVWISVTVP